MPPLYDVPNGPLFIVKYDVGFTKGTPEKSPIPTLPSGVILILSKTPFDTSALSFEAVPLAVLNTIVPDCVDPPVTKDIPATA